MYASYEPILYDYISNRIVLSGYDRLELIDDSDIVFFKKGNMYGYMRLSDLTVY